MVGGVLTTVLTVVNDDVDVDNLAVVVVWRLSDRLVVDGEFATLDVDGDDVFEDEGDIARAAVTALANSDIVDGDFEFGGVDGEAYL